MDSELQKLVQQSIKLNLSIWDYVESTEISSELLDRTLETVANDCAMLEIISKRESK